MASFDVIYLVCAILLGSATVYKSRDLFRSIRTPGQQAAIGPLSGLCAALASATGAFILANPVTYVWVDRSSGIPNLATPMVYTCVVVFASSIQVMLLYYQHTPDKAWSKVRWRMASAALVVLTMWALFAIADIPDEHPLDFDMTYSTTPVITAFLAIFLVAYTAGMADILHLCSKWRREAPTVWLRRGLHCISIASYWALGYTVCKVIGIAGRWAGTTTLDVLGNAVGPASASVGALFFSVGFTLPALGPKVANARQWIDHYRSYHQLYPLWYALTEEYSGIKMPFPTSRYGKLLARWLGSTWRSHRLVTVFDTRLAFRHLEDRLLRRTMEIRDVQMALGPYVDERVTSTAQLLAKKAGLQDNGTAAVILAAQLKGALATKKSGAPRPENTCPFQEIDAGFDLSDEAAWLAEVARAFSRSPIPDAALGDNSKLSAPERAT